MKMSRWMVGLAGAVLLAGGGMLYYQGDRAPQSGMRPEVIERTEFPKGTIDMVGNVRGEMCHEVRLRNSAGEQVIGREEIIPDADFRLMTGEQKEDAIKASALRIWERAGMLAECQADPALPFPGLASDATAQPHCLDCEGTCGGASCPAHVIPTGGCQMQGPDCIISVYCCNAGCSCS